ncbi:fibrinogen alpha chain-like [Salarias fasciatus]|nr:fibrinogen alpha chain-like [Salarias fasciatus]
MGMSENNRFEPTSNPELTAGQKITPDQAGTLPDEKLTLNHNTATFNQESVTESMKKSDGNPLLETEEHSTLGQKKTPDQVNTWQDQKFKPDQEIHTILRIPESEEMEKNEKSPTFKPTSNRESTPGRKITPERVNTRLDQKLKPSVKNPKINQRPKPGQGLKPNQKLSKSATDLKTKPNVSRKTDQPPQTNQQLKTPRPNLNPKPRPDEVSRAVSNKTSKHPLPNRLPIRPRVKPEATPVQRPKPEQSEPISKTELDPDLPAVSWTTADGIQNSQTGMPPAAGPGKEIAEVSHSSKGTELNPSMRKVVTLDPKTAKSLETGPFPNLHTLHEDFTVSLNSRTMSNLKTQTTSQPPSPPTTTRPVKSMHRMPPSDVSSSDQGFTKPYLILKSDSSSQANTLQNVEEPASTIPSPSSQITSTPSPNYRSTTSPTSGLKPSGADSSTPSARELRVKINQVAAFLNNSLSPNGRQPVRHPKPHPEDTQWGSRPDRADTPSLTPSKVSTVVRDCSDHLLRGVTESGVYLVTPDLRSRSFPVFCDMEREGGGWTVLQRRLDGSVSFNRSWAEYQAGFGELRGGEFWLGNSLIHLLTRERDMTLRVELQDFDGVEEHAQYAQFRVASERLRYRLTVGGYSGTAGDALRFNKQYDHNNRAFTTPDRDNDRYPSGNCGAYYSSGWWFDACMAANLNGRYYEGSYKGVRDGIFWGTWHNISMEYYPTNDRQSFKTVRMMIRPTGFVAP